jgi:hypothetical protein|tara:strand:- start:506 stop:670 length:165 start_codon:yes stop_codon:yes gene_type:complete
MSKSSPRKNGSNNEPGPSFHEKKPKNAKDYNMGKGEKKRLNKTKKHGTGGKKKR